MVFHSKHSRVPIVFALTGLALVLVVASTAYLLTMNPTIRANTVNITTPDHAVLPTTDFSTTSPIAVENQKPGTTAWMLDPKADLQSMQAYASAVSALPGQQVQVFVSSRQTMTYRLEVYRTGWYQGKGGYLYLSQANLTSLAQGLWFQTPGLEGCQSCTTDPITNLTDAHWQSSYTLTIGATWPTGAYLLKIIGATGAETYIPLVVRTTTPTAVLVNIPVNTYQAYNVWGNCSLYQCYRNGVNLGAAVKATQVSFNRPLLRSVGTGDFLAWDIQNVRWFERYGLDVSYVTDVDLDQNPQLFLQHRVFLAVGHDEYWTKPMYDGITTARNQGVSLGFLGANDIFWSARLAPDAENDADRTLVCYKVARYPHAPSEKPSNDPDYRTHPSLVTSTWSDPLQKRPEEQMTGLFYEASFSDPHYYPNWDVVDSTSDPLLDGTGLSTGSVVSGGLVGYEVDGLPIAFPFPSKGVTLLAEEVIVNRYGGKCLAASSYYRDPHSHALVFDAGTIQWGWGLDGLALPYAWMVNHVGGSPAISRLTENLINAMLAASPVAPSTVVHGVRVQGKLASPFLPTTGRFGNQ
jgi:hypothetical protein